MRADYPTGAFGVVFKMVRRKPVIAPVSQNAPVQYAPLRIEISYIPADWCAIKDDSVPAFVRQSRNIARSNSKVVFYKIALINDKHTRPA